MFSISSLRVFPIFFIALSVCAGCSASPPILTSTQTSLPTWTATKTLLSTATPTFTPASIPTNTPGSFAVFQAEPPKEGYICGEYTVIPQKGSPGYPVDYEPVAYVRAYTMQESISLNLVVVEWGLFVKPNELNETGGKTVYSYDIQRSFWPYSAIALKNAPSNLRETLKNKSAIAGLEIVDLQNNPLSILISEKSVKDITYAIDDLTPHPLLDLALPCPGFVDGHPINYAPLQATP